LTLLLLGIFVQAADFQVSAALDRQQIALNEQAQLSVTISGSGSAVPKPQLPPLTDFQVYSAGTSQNFSWINGQASASVTYTYVLTPLKEGHFTIAPIRVQSQNQSAQTPELSLDVVKGDAAAVPGGSAEPAAPAPSGERRPAEPAIFITATVDKKTVYVGEPVTFSFRLYNRVALLSQPSYQAPQTAGFWAEDLPPQRSFTTTVRGIPYHVTEVRTALFPTTPGKARIGPAALSVRLENLGTDPFSNDFFAQFFGRGEEKTLHTEPLSIRVQALPEPKPAGFKGAVGRYALSAGVDKDHAVVGQPLTLTLTVSGRGNIKSLPDLEVPPLSNFRTFDANAATNIEKKDYQVEGSKVFKTVLIPTASGELSIPSVPFVYFDPEKGAYQSVHSRAFSVHVAAAPGGGSSASAPAYAPPGAGAGAPGIHILEEDIRYIRTPPSLSPQGAPLYRRLWFQAWMACLFLLLALGGLLRLYQKLFLSNTRLTRFRGARANALLSAQQAQGAMERLQTREAAGLLADALQGYLAAKLGADRQTLSLKEVLAELKAHGVHSHDTEKVRNLWETLDLFQFAPAQVRPDELRQALRTLEHVVDELEKDIPWKN